MSKTSARRMRQQQRRREESRSARAFVVGVAAVIAVVGTVLAVGVTGGSGSPPPAVDEVELTGSAGALGLVADPKTVAMGHVPLDRTVVPEWKLTNGGDTTVALGKPHAEVVEGCCPGPLQVGAATLGAGESTELTFPLQMHAGMDGPHEFSIHVPVEQDGQRDLLELTVTGHFSS